MSREVDKLCLSPKRLLCAERLTGLVDQLCSTHQLAQGLGPPREVVAVGVLGHRSTAVAGDDLSSGAVQDDERGNAAHGKLGSQLLLQTQVEGTDWLEHSSMLMGRSCWSNAAVSRTLVSRCS